MQVNGESFEDWVDRVFQLVFWVYEGLLEEYMFK